MALMMFERGAPRDPLEAALFGDFFGDGPGAFGLLPFAGREVGQPGVPGRKRGGCGLGGRQEDGPGVGCGVDSQQPGSAIPIVDLGDNAARRAMRISTTTIFTQGIECECVCHLVVAAGGTSTYQ